MSSGRHFTKLPDELIDTERVDRNAKLVMIVLLRYAGANGTCFPSLAEIARKARMSKSSVRRAISDLVESKLLTYTRRTEEGSDEPASNLYRVDAVFQPDRWFQSEHTYGHGGHTYSHSEHGVVSPWNGGGVTVNTEVDTLKKTQEVDRTPGPEEGLPTFVDYWLKRCKRRGGIEYPQTFEHFWSLYPRQDGKRAAFKAWLQSLKGGATIDELADAADRYAQRVKDTERRFVKQAATFLGVDEPWRDFTGETADNGKAELVETEPSFRFLGGGE